MIHLRSEQLQFHACLRGPSFHLLNRRLPGELQASSMTDTGYFDLVTPIARVEALRSDISACL